MDSNQNNQAEFNQQDAYSQQSYEQQAFDQQTNSQMGYSQQAYTQQAFDQQGYLQQAYTDQGYDQQNFAQSTYNQQAFAQPAYQGATPVIQAAKASSDSKFMAFHGFVDPDEKIVATLKNGIVKNLISGEGFKNEDAILTDKRMYYNHTNGIINTIRVEEKIDVQDITGTKILDVKPRILIVLAFIAAIAGFAIGDEAIGIGLISAVVLALIYMFSVKKHLRIEYAGGNINFSVRKYSLKNVQAFQCAIHSLKDSLR